MAPILTIHVLFFFVLFRYKFFLLTSNSLIFSTLLRIRNAWVRGSSPRSGSKFENIENQLVRKEIEKI